jgi:hypothetical protein
MDAADNIHVLVIDGIPIESLLVEVQNDANIVIGIIDGLVLDLVTTLLENQLAWKA